MRILGLDYGSKTVGVAMTDALGMTVQPYKTIQRDRESKLRPTLSEIAEIVEQYQIEKIVMGLPLNMDDTEGDRAAKTRDFAEKLKLRVEAEAILDQSGIPRSEQKKVIDQVAAQLILEQYLRG